MRRVIAIALILTAAITSPLCVSALAQLGTSVAIYHSFLNPVYMASIIDRDHVLVLSKNLMSVVNPITGVTYFKYAMYGAPVALATDYAYSPSTFAIATDRGEILAVKRYGSNFTVTKFRFYGSIKILRLYTTSTTLYALTLEGTIRRLVVMNISKPSWCEIGVPPSNMVPTSNSYIKVIDFINAVTGSKHGLETTPLIVLIYSRFPRVPPNSTVVTVITMVDNVTIPNAIVELRYGTVTQFQYTDQHGKARFYVPINVTTVTIMAFYINKSSGVTYYAKQVLRGPLRRTVAYTIILRLQPSFVAVPRVVSTVFLSLYRVPAANCGKFFSKPIATIPLNISNPNQIKLLNAYVSGGIAIIVYSSLAPTYIGPLWTIGVLSIDTYSGKMLWQGIYYIPSPATYAAFSNDGHLIAVATQSNILYILWSPAFGKYRIVDSYKLPAQPTTIRVARESYGYLILVGCNNGAVIALAYISNGLLLPINRGSTLYLSLAPPAYVASDPSASLIAIATQHGLFYIANLGPNALKVVGYDLSRFITRNIVVSISGSTSRALISLGSPKTEIVIGSRAVFKNVPAGLHNLLIVPTNPYAPRARMLLNVGVKGVNITVSFLNPFNNKSLIITVYQKLRNETKVIASGVASFSFSLPYGSKASYEISFSNIPVGGYDIPAYTNASLSVYASEDRVVIQLAMPKWRRASRIELCLFTPRGTAVTNASVAIVGTLTKYSTELALNPKTRCFEAFNIPYDVYNVTFISLPINLQRPSNVKLAVAQPTLISRQTLLYKPLTLTIVFSEPPRVPLDVYIAGRHIRVHAGTKNVSISGIYPGTYTLTVKPIPALKTFDGKIAVPYYYDVSKRVGVFANETLRLDLRPRYIYVAIDVRDQIDRKSGPLEPVRIEVNGINIAVLTSKNHVIGGYIPIDSKTNITIVPTSQVYKKVVRILEPSKLHLRNGTTITIYVPRQKFKVSLIVLSSLGERIQGALVIPTCNTITPSPSITDSSGKVVFYVPALSNCVIKIVKEGYYGASKSIFVGTANVYETITLRAKPLTILLHYINVLTAAIVIGSVIGIMLYLKKRIEAKLESTVEEII